MSADSLIETGTGEAALEVRPGRLTRTAADRLAALTARGANAASVMIHVAEGGGMRLIGGYELPTGFAPMQNIPVSKTLAGVVMHYRFPVVIADMADDARVPRDSPGLAVGLRSYAGFPVRDPKGAVVGVCAAMDYLPREWTVAELAAADDGAQACTAFVAERQARDAEREQRHFLDAVLNSLDTGVAACDPRGKLVIVNRSLADRLGERVEQTGQALTHALRGGQLRGAEQTFDARLFSVNANPIADEHGRRLGAVSVFHDITEARRAEDLQRALSQAKDEYLNLVGHELRTPLTVIASYLDLIADGDPAEPLADSLAMVQAARRGSERLRRLIEALLDLSALDSGRAELRQSDVDLVRLVSQAVKRVLPKIEAKAIEMYERLPERMPLWGDPDRLTQMIAVLLDNAVTYTPVGGSVTLTLSAVGPAVRLELADTGVGIPEDEAPRVFDRFYRGAVATEMSIPGAGLGLSLARMIAERHRGTVTLGPNSPRTGTIVRVTLPR